MMTAYSIYKEDLDNVATYFSDFNKTFDVICDTLKDLTGEDIRNGANARAVQRACESLKQKIANSMAGTEFSQKYREDELIGRGCFGEAWKIISKLNSEVFVMKVILCTKEDVKAAKNEIELLKKCRHESIVRYIEDFYEKSRFLIIMEFCSGGDLARFIKAQTKLLPVDFIFQWVIQLLSGVCFIHQKKIIHRDLKPANIFLMSDKKLKIGDFGIAKGLERTLAKTFAGTPVYMAPEIHWGQKYDMMADMWSLGIIVFEIITFKIPFDFLQAVFKE